MALRSNAKTLNPPTAWSHGLLNPKATANGTQVITQAKPTNNLTNGVIFGLFACC
jgi:hypothetical protein